MEKKSRTFNSAFNSIFGILSYLIVMIVTFFMRKVFVDTLGKEFLGINSLYTNIINMLSLTELGLGTAMLFFLYKPVNDGDGDTVKAYMSFYKTLYRIIAGIVFVIGIALMFFIQYFVKDTTITLRDLRIYFLLFVVNSSISYLLAYKRSILYADQKNRVISVIYMLSKVIFNVVQIITLYFFKNFVIFISLYMACTILDNLLCSIFVNKKYPQYIGKPAQSLSKEKKKEIFKKAKPLFVQNIVSFIVTSTDNLIISIFISVSAVGIYSNYILIIATLKAVFSQIFSAFTTSFGNLAVSEDPKHCRKVYDRALFFAFWFNCFCSACFISLIQPFIQVVFGADYLFGLPIPILIMLSFYFMGMNIPAISVQNAVGLHQKDQWVMVAQGVFNLAASLILVNFIGIAGVVLGTVLSTILFPLISKEYVASKYLFKCSPAKSYVKHLIYFLSSITVSALCFFVCNVLLPGSGVWFFILRCLISVVLSNLLLIIMFYQDANFKYFIGLVLRIFRRKNAEK